MVIPRVLEVKIRVLQRQRLRDLRHGGGAGRGVGIAPLHVRNAGERPDVVVGLAALVHWHLWGGLDCCQRVGQLAEQVVRVNLAVHLIPNQHSINSLPPSWARDRRQVVLPHEHVEPVGLRQRLHHRGEILAALALEIGPVVEHGVNADLLQEVGVVFVGSGQGAVRGAGPHLDRKPLGHDPATIGNIGTVHRHDSSPNLSRGLLHPRHRNGHVPALRHGPRPGRQRNSLPVVHHLGHRASCVAVQVDHGLGAGAARGHVAHHHAGGHGGHGPAEGRLPGCVGDHDAEGALEGGVARVERQPHLLGRNIAMGSEPIQVGDIAPLLQADPLVPVHSNGRDLVITQRHIIQHHVHPPAVGGVAGAGL
mmetsp:Transcript_21268/g.51440  ORF Transcript_21268/g.51440 Transcript_21268/m.51440 type:complete len:365 (-) Transcript_21268:63-1157(-)